MEILASMLLAEQDYGTVTAVEVPSVRLEEAQEGLRAIGREDLILVLSGSAELEGIMLVTAGGTVWRFGGL